MSRPDTTRETLRAICARMRAGCTDTAILRDYDVSPDIIRMLRHSVTPSPYNRTLTPFWAEHDVDLIFMSQIEGLSSAEVGTALKRTRSSVIGRLYRLGGSFSGTSSAPSRPRAPKVERPRAPRTRPATIKVESKPKPRIVFPAEPLPPEVIDEATPRMPILIRDVFGNLSENPALTNTCCRWPIGDPSSDHFGFCGKEKVPGLPYCQPHSARAFTPPKPARSRAPAVPVQPPAHAESESESVA